MQSHHSQPTWWMSIMKSWAHEGRRRRRSKSKKKTLQAIFRRAKSGFWLVFIAIRHCVLLYSSLLLSKLTKNILKRSLWWRKEGIKRKKSHPQIIIMLPCMRRIIYEMNEALCHIHPSIHEFLLSLCRVCLPFFLHAAHLFQSNHLSLPHRGRRRLRIAPKFPDLIKLSKARKISILP